MKSFLAPNRIILAIALVFVFALGLVIRFYDLTDLPMDFHSTRQLHSAIIARGMYYEHLDSAPTWQREMAVRQWKAEGLIEPPILESLTALTYRLIGSEKLWVARVYSILFWTLGAAALFLLALELAGVDGALIALVYFLILPYGALASRSFQPDPLLISLIIFTWWAMARFQRTPTLKWAILAGVLGGAALFTKTVAVFFVGGAWLGLVLFGGNFLKTIRSPKIWLIAAITALPSILFYIYGTLFTGQLQSQFSLRFFPQLWRDPVFYLQWNGELSSVVGFEWFLVALLASLLVRQRSLRAMLLGGWFGYFVYGMTFAYHISTHDYYQLPLIPLVALGLAAAAQLFFEAISANRRWFYPLVLGVLLFAMTVKAWDVRVTLKRMDYQSEATVWQKLGQRLGQNVSVVGLTQDSGYRLAYWGWVDSTQWMTSGDFNVRVLNGAEFDMEKLFADEVAGKDYFVVTMMGELDSQPALKNMLYQHYPLIEESDDYLIFDLKHPKP